MTSRISRPFSSTQRARSRGAFSLGTLRATARRSAISSTTSYPSSRVLALMATPERPDRPVWQVLLALAGAATAIVIVVYLIGGAIVWERLHILHLPANQAVASLPRELLLIDGIRALAWPVVLGLLVGGLVALFAHIARFGQRRARVAWAVLLVLWIGGLLLLKPVGKRILPHVSTWQKFGFLVALGVLVALAVVAAHQHVPLQRAALGAALAMVAVVAAIEANDISSPPVRLEYAHVLLTHPKKTRRGFYIGATSDTVYLAPNDGCHVRRSILALPRSRVVNVAIFTSTKAWPQGEYPDKRKDCSSPR